jgi:hypothetical protein
MEAKPGQTTNMMRGSYTKDEIAGKGERSGNAVDDLFRLSTLNKKDSMPKDIKNIDTSGATKTEQKGSEDIARNQGKIFISGYDDLSAPSETSDHDSVMEDIEDDYSLKEKKKKKRRNSFIV